MKTTIGSSNRREPHARAGCSTNRAAAPAARERAPQRLGERDLGGQAVGRDVDAQWRGASSAAVGIERVHAPRDAAEERARRVAREPRERVLVTGVRALDEPRSFFLVVKRRDPDAPCHC